MTRREVVWLLALTCLLAFVLAACGDGEENSTQTATASVAPSPLGTGTPATGLSPTAVVNAGDARVIDLATTAPMLTVFAVDTGDLRNDVPSLAVGDFNGDGVDDLLAGARFGDGPDDSREDSGEAYLILGSTDLPSTVDLANGEQDLTIFGQKAGDYLGFGVAAADLNDDGTDDIIVSSPTSEGIQDPDFRTDRGEVYVIFGGPDLGGVMDLATQEPDVTIIAAEGFSLMGDSMASGDVNGDGIDDLVLGAPFAGREPGAPHGGPRTELGEVYVIFGSPDLGGSISIPEKQQNFTISGPEQYSELGDAMAVGDVNDDGKDDIIAVAEAADGPDAARPNTGVVYVVFGSSDLSGVVETAQNQQDLMIVGATDQDALGFSAASRDVNGDDIDDIILVAQRADAPGRETSGEAYVIYGSRDLGGTIDVAKGEQDVTIEPADAHDLLTSCAAGRDLNDDGIDEIMLGTGFGQGPANQRDGAGEAYVIFGSDNLSSTIDLAQPSYDIVIFGAHNDDRLGGAVTTGDLNDDGHPEIIVVAVGVDGPGDGRPDAGAIYAISAGNEGR